MSNYLVTGVAGFIGARVAEMLTEQGHTVVGVDNLNNAYDVRMKEYRLKRFQARPGFTFIRADISDRASRSPIPNRQSTLRCGYQPGSACRGSGKCGEPMGFLRDQRHRNPELARTL